MADKRQVNQRVKPRKKKKRKKKRYFLKFCILVALCVGMYYFLTSHFFDIQKIKVENNNYYTSEQIIEMTGLKTGKNLFEISANNAKQKLLKDPYIANANVLRIPPGKIIVKVEERREFAAIPYGSSFALIDKDGLVLRRTNVEPALPQVMGMTVKKLKVGKPLEVEENALLTDTLKLIGEMEDSEIYFKKIDISSVIVKAYIYDYLTCEGTLDNIRSNLGQLKEVLQKFYEQGIERGVVKVGSDGEFFHSPEIN